MDKSETRDAHQNRPICPCWEEPSAILHSSVRFSNPSSCHGRERFVSLNWITRLWHEKLSCPGVRSRLGDLNTKAYYLLVALSFIYVRAAGTQSTFRWIKWALALTAVSAVLPLQDYPERRLWLEMFRLFKVLCLTAALICTLVWIISPS